MGRYHYGRMHRDRHPHSASGFTLIEVAVVLVIIAVFMTMGAVVFRGVTAAQKRSITQTRMATVDAAILQFVMVNKRLPCPADGRLASGATNAGVESFAAGTCTLMQHGVAPWVTLGITETEATDGWERRLTYRVDTDLVTIGIDMSWCDPAGSSATGPSGGPCNTTCTNSTIATNCTPPSQFLIQKGFEIRNVAGTVLMEVQTVATTPKNAAAYVLISHGESGGGGYLSTGTISTSTGTDGTEEQKNYANLVLQPYYVDDALNDVPGTAHFDDFVSRPSVLALAVKAGLGPRSH